MIKRPTRRCWSGHSWRLMAAVELTCVIVKSVLRINKAFFWDIQLSFINFVKLLSKRWYSFLCCFACAPLKVFGNYDQSLFVIFVFFITLLEGQIYCKCTDFRVSFSPKLASQMSCKFSTVNRGFITNSVRWQLRAEPYLNGAFLIYFSKGRIMSALAGCLSEESYSTKHPAQNCLVIQVEMTPEAVFQKIGAWRQMQTLHTSYS